jgi:hypothetical protein
MVPLKIFEEKMLELQSFYEAMLAYITQYAYASKEPITYTYIDYITNPPNLLKYNYV